MEMVNPPYSATPNSRINSALARATSPRISSWRTSPLKARRQVSKGTLTPHNPPFGKVPPGSGPRHGAFLPGGKTFYALNDRLLESMRRKVLASPLVRDDTE